MSVAILTSVTLQEKLIAFSHASYATGLCKQTISGYSDWYLPAICEMGYTDSDVQPSCGTQEVPTLQNMESSLKDRLDSFFLSGYYWSSTESNTRAATQA